MSRSRSRAAARTVVRLCGDLARFAAAVVRSHAHLAAENLFLKKQLALYVERQVRPRRADDATRIALVALSQLVIGVGSSPSCSPPRSFDGIARDIGCSGG
jgi:hypothetical protein